MSFTGQDGIALLQLIVYIPLLPLAILLCMRHGFARSSGWRFALFFILIRIAGGIASMVTISNPTQDAYVTVLVCASIGLSPLVLLVTGLLSRLNDQLASHRRAPPVIFKGIAVVSLVGLILSIYGGTTSSANQNSYGTNTYTRVGNVLFAGVWVFSVLLFAFLMTRINEVMQGEKRLLVAIGIDLPFILARLVYSLAHVFTGNRLFAGTFGNLPLYLCMAVLEEIVVIIVTLGIGFTLEKIAQPAQADTEAAGGMKLTSRNENSGDGGRFRENLREPVTSSQRRKKAKGPIGFLVLSIWDGVENLRNNRR